MKLLLAPMLCTILVACGQVATETAPSSDPRIELLSADHKARDSEIAALDARVQILEAASQEQSIAVANIATEQSKVDNEVGGPWVAWLKEVPTSIRLGMGYKPDTPVGAFPTRGQCVDAIRAATAQNGGDQDQARYLSNNGQYEQMNTYACLPNGTDPRIKR